MPSNVSNFLVHADSIMLSKRVVRKREQESIYTCHFQQGVSCLAKIIFSFLPPSPPPPAQHHFFFLVLDVSVLCLSRYGFFIRCQSQSYAVLITGLLKCQINWSYVSKQISFYRTTKYYVCLTLTAIFVCSIEMCNLFRENKVLIYSRSNETRPWHIGCALFSCLAEMGSSKRLGQLLKRDVHF